VRRVCIHEPIWATRSLGVCNWQWSKGDILLSCDYKTTDGKKIMKGVYQVSEEYAKKFPRIAIRQYVGYAIPIIELEKLQLYKKEKKSVKTIS